MDLNQMLREQASVGLQTQLDQAVTNGDTEAARKISAQIATLAVSTAPKAPAYGDAEIRASLDAKAPWFGTDPKKSAKAVEFGKTMDPKKFASAEAFADAIVKAVDEEFKPAILAPKDDEDEDGEGDDADGEDEEEKPVVRKARRTDGPGESDTNGRPRRGSTGPWEKLTDAPREIQAEVKRQADKFAPKTKEGREAFVKRALEAHQRAHAAKQGKK